jgi:DNA-cytosine methyltransferase
MAERGPRFTFAECFSGIGGFRIALEAAGGQCVFACEYCRFATAAYQRHWPDGPKPVGDIRRIVAAQVPAHDVLAAGFPCQSFSNAGRGKLFDDPRGQLFYELVRLVAGCQPRCVLLENVRGLLTRPGALDEVRRALGEIGYPRLHVRLLDAALLVPQRRRRLFIVGFRDDVCSGRRHFAWPLLPSLRRTAEEILEPAACAAAQQLTLPVDKWRKVEESAYYAKFPAARLLTRGSLAQTLQTTYKGGCLLYSQFVPQEAMPEEGGPPQPCTAPHSRSTAPPPSTSEIVAEVSTSTAPPPSTSEIVAEVSTSTAPPPSTSEIVAEVSTSTAPSPSTSEIVAEVSASTAPPPSTSEIVAEVSTSTVPPPPRFFTPLLHTAPPPRFFSPRECARLMGFPEVFPLPQAEGVGYRLLGNAVCPPLVGAIAAAIASALDADADYAPSTSGSSIADRGDAASPEALSITDDAGDAANPEAIAVAMQLALNASPPDRLPVACWLPQTAVQALGLPVSPVCLCQADPPLNSHVEGHVEGHAEGHVEGGSPSTGMRTRCDEHLHARQVTSGSPSTGPPFGEPCRLAGGAYHEPLDTALLGPFPISLVVLAAQQHSQRPVPTKVWQRDARCPVQTLPSPTSAMKAHVATAYMRRYTYSMQLRAHGYW